jgi:hypothetical protein
LFSGSQVTQSRVVGNMSANWTVAAVGDFNGDGKADIIWQDNATGAQTEWLMNGTRVTQVPVANNHAFGFILDGLGSPSANLSQGYLAGVYAGGSVGSLNVSNTFTNRGQFSLCPPQPAVCIPDFTPSPVGSASNSGVAGNFIVGYNQPLPFARMIVGFEMSFGGGGSEAVIVRIPGTFGPGGIAPTAGAAGDSVSLTPGWNAGIIGRVGTTFQVGAVPFFVAFDGGVGFQHVNLAINCTGAAGACGANGILLQSLTTSSTLTGSLIGGEINTKLGAILPVSGLNLGFLNNATVGFQYLHGDFGNLTTTLGTPTQFQVTSGVKVTTDSAMARFTFPLAENTSPMPSDRVFVNYDYFKGLH